MRAALAAAAVSALTLAAGAQAATTPTAPVYDPQGRLVDAPFAPAPEEPRLGEAAATRVFLAHGKVRRWLDRYPPDPVTDATFDRKTRLWRVRVWSGRAGQVADGRVEDRSGRVTEAWTGPQVAWSMARGSRGAFGGKILNEPAVWLTLCAVFVLGLANLRRPLSLRNLDLLVLVAFSVSLWFFNRGEIFRSVPLVYPPLAYLLVRTAVIGFGGRSERRPVAVWPVWLLAALAVFLAGFRVGLNVQAPRTVIDVGYASVIGGQRIVDGEAPYGNMPVEAGRPACGEADRDGRIRERVQTNGRCEASNERGDTYGPVAYLAYVPAVLALGWSGKWDGLPAAHATAIAFDLLTMLGLALVGRRFGGARLAATLAFAWAAYPFTTYVLMSNSNDALMPAFLVWGFWLATSPAARGGLSALAGWTKFGALLVVPLWLCYPELRARTALRFAAGFAAASAVAFSVLLLEPSLTGALSTFWERTFGFQLGRDSPFSPWGWGQYHAAGIPDLALAQTALQAGVIALAGVAAVVPTRKGPLQLAALTAALLLAFQLVLTHWFYLYLPWALPFVVLALFLPRPEADARPA